MIKLIGSKVHVVVNGTGRYYNVVRNPKHMLSVQHSFPRSKRMRIRKKWEKRAENWKKVIDPRIVMVGDLMVGHPTIIDEMLAIIKADSNENVTVDCNLDNQSFKNIRSK